MRAKHLRVSADEVVFEVFRLLFPPPPTPQKIVMCSQPSNPCGTRFFEKRIRAISKKKKKKEKKERKKKKGKKYQRRKGKGKGKGERLRNTYANVYFRVTFYFRGGHALGCAAWTSVESQSSARRQLAAAPAESNDCPRSRTPRCAHVQGHIGIDSNVAGSFSENYLLM